MKRVWLGCGLVFVSLAAGCADVSTTQKETPAGEQTAAAAQAAKEAKTDDRRSDEKAGDDKRDDELRNQIEQIAAAARGRVGVAASLLETGETVALNPHERFPMQSVYKFPIGMATLQQVDAGRIKLEQRVRVEKSDFVKQGQRSPIRDKHPNGAELSVEELLRLMVSESDGTASDVLLELVGGPEAVGRFLNELEVTEMVIANTEKEFGEDYTLQYRNWSSPRGAVALLRALHERRGLSEQSRALLLKLMTETPTGPRRLKALLPAGTTVAHKTGTSGDLKGITAATNDVGIVTLPDGRHFAIAVFVSDSPADEATREGVIARVAGAVWDKWSR